MRILLVEDDVVVATGVEEALRRESYSIDHCLSAEDALPAIATTGYDLAIVDIGLPGMNGRSFIDRIRRDGNSIPVIILSALDGFDDRVRGLDVGADDYVTKPFSIAELSARIRARLRRDSGEGRQGIVAGALRMHLGLRTADVSGTPIDLTAREWDVLFELAIAAPRIVSKQKLTDSLGGWRSEITSNAVEIYVSRIRAKLHGTGVGVLTVRGLGYRLEEQH
jgi:DNA-binding response OmpR family regulator